MNIKDLAPNSYQEVKPVSTGRLNINNLPANSYKVVEDVNALGSAISGAKQAIQQKESATFNPLKIVDKYFTSIGKTAVNAWDDLNTGYKNKTIAGKISETGQTSLKLI